VRVHGVDHGHGIVPVPERGHDHGRDHGHGHDHGNFTSQVLIIRSKVSAWRFSPR
jgi:hypothetical protein